MSVENLKLQGTLVYVRMDQPTDCFDTSKGQEYKAGVVVDEDTADDFAEKFPKQAARKVKRSDFEGIFKCKPPEGDEKNLYVITLKRNSKFKDKKTGEMQDLPPKWRPRVLQKKGNALVDTTMTELVGNGSKGIISFEVGNTQYGDVARLKNVLVTELVEYIKPEGSEYEVGDEFSDVVKSIKEKPKAEVKAKPKSKPVESDEELDSLPF